MRQAQKNKEKDKIAIVLMLCFCVIALTSIFTVKSSIDKINDNASDMIVSEDTKTDAAENQKNIPEAKVENPKKTDNSHNTSVGTSNASANIPTVDSLKGSTGQSNLINPVKSENRSLRNPYAVDELIYSVTLDQYMTHCGVDIEAKEDTQVVAAAGGTITSVYEDDRFGTSIEITHPDNLITVYSNLSTTEMVEVGDVVEQGQIISGVGSSALFESMEPAHLHFEVIKDGAYVDPSEYLTF